MINGNVLLPGSQHSEQQHSAEDQSGSDEVSFDGSEGTDLSSEESSESGDGLDVQGEVKKYGGNDTDGVKKWLSVVTFTIFSVAAVVMVSTYVFLSNQEEGNFVDAYQTSANAIVDAVIYRSQTLYMAIHSNSESITSFSLYEGISWPFVTIPHFSVRSRNYRRETGAEIYGFAPLVRDKDRPIWEAYSVERQDWMYDDDAQTGDQTFAAIDILAMKAAFAKAAAQKDLVTLEDQQDEGSFFTINEKIFRYQNSTNPVQEDSLDHYAPLWQSTPTLPSLINLNLLTASGVKDQISSMTKDGRFKVTEMLFESELHADELEHGNETGISSTGVLTNETNNEQLATTFLFEPIYRDFQSKNSVDIVGLLFASVVWKFFFHGMLPAEEVGVLVILENTCGQLFTYKIDGPEVTLLGEGDLHDDNYKNLQVTQKISWDMHDEEDESENGMCDYYVHVYPTDENRFLHTTRRPAAFTFVIAFLFSIMIIVFYIYVKVVHRRQVKLMETAARTSAIVSSLFPANVRDRIMKEAEGKAGASLGGDGATKIAVQDAARSKLQSFTANNDESESPGADESGKGHLDRRVSAKNTKTVGVYGTKPIADLFPEATVLFADMVGFTAWSSIREPTQVFELLETIYHGFDKIAKRRRVFKVETIGDCYVAVTGLPEPRKDHAIAMTYFANNCLKKMGQLTKDLELSLGPDTGDLTMRFGLHSGPVTAGVLRGSKSRFQLFGDTVNTAARMESNGQKDKIHVSQSTANLLIKAGKGHWVTPREDKIQAKGKGEMQTYWVLIRSSHENASSISSGSDHSKNTDIDIDKSYGDNNSLDGSMGTHDLGVRVNDKFQRLVEWNVDQLLGLLEKIVAKRIMTEEEAKSNPKFDLRAKTSIIDEVKDVIPSITVNMGTRRDDDSVDSVEMDDDVVSQLHDFVESIATFYRNNPFHNFSHASHVAMSVMKLIHRIVSESGLDDTFDEDDEDEEDPENSVSLAFNKPFETNDIVSDPLTQFALVLAALVHDVEHSGIPNSQLIKEEAKVAKIYNNRSIHEQSSADLAFEVLMDDQYEELRNAIFRTEKEFNRFRQIMINSVMATDVLDQNCLQRQNERWALAFKDSPDNPRESFVSLTNRKATVLIEHMIQASDVSHTMQHWHVYRKWNELLFQESYLAYKAGRCEFDPVETWYDSELNFFDTFVIPLARKLTESGAFGLSCDEYLTYAQNNREEWKNDGKSEIKAMVERAKDMYVEEARGKKKKNKDQDEDFDSCSFQDETTPSTQENDSDSLE